MKILIKAHCGTYMHLNDKNMNHISYYWNFLMKDTFTKMGHEVKFIGQTAKDNDIVNDYNEYDLLLFRGLNAWQSLEKDKEFSFNLLKNFKGKKILYLEACRELPFLKYFDCILLPELYSFKRFYDKKYPTIPNKMINWTCAGEDLLDKDIKNPYPTKLFRSIFCGILIKRFLDNSLALANKGEHIVLGGNYWDGKVLRQFTEEEIKGFPSTVQLINGNGKINLGDQIPYIRYADVALNYYPADFYGGLSSKLIEYLACGCPVIAEYYVPNKFRIKQLNAGQIVPYNDVDALYNAIQKEKKIVRDRNKIKFQSRKMFSPEKVCSQIIKIVENL